VYYIGVKKRPPQQQNQTWSRQQQQQQQQSINLGEPIWVSGQREEEGGVSPAPLPALYAHNKPDPFSYRVQYVIYHTVFVFVYYIVYLNALYLFSSLSLFFLCHSGSPSP
jgi:hypothetical protein